MIKYNVQGVLIKQTDDDEEVFDGTVLIERSDESDLQTMGDDEDLSGKINLIVDSDGEKIIMRIDIMEVYRILRGMME